MYNHTDINIFNYSTQFLKINLKVRSVSVKIKRNFVFYFSETQISSKYDRDVVEKLVFYEHSQITCDFTFFFFCDGTLFFKDIDFFLTLLIILVYVRQTLILKPSSQNSQSRVIYGSQKETAENAKGRWTDTLIITLASNIFSHTYSTLTNTESIKSSIWQVVFKKSCLLSVREENTLLAES